MEEENKFAMSILNFYCFKNKFAKSFQLWICELSNNIYQWATEPISLSWKHWINSLSSWEWADIFRQYMTRWLFGQVVPLCFSNSSFLNFKNLLLYKMHDVLYVYWSNAALKLLKIYSLACKVFYKKTSFTFK